MGTDDDDFGNIQLVAPSQDDILRGSWKPAVPPLGLMHATCDHDTIIFLLSFPEPASRGGGEAAAAGHHQPGPAGRGRGQSGGEGQTC